jgi:hypothetical protein
MSWLDKTLLVWYNGETIWEIVPIHFGFSYP